MRLDVFLTENGYFESRKRASDSIKGGLVWVNGKSVTKPSFDTDSFDKIDVKGEICPYVGRGGFKLEKALSVFGVDPQGMVCVDIGSSTGGFTDCLLQKGASKVFAVDSGKDQLHTSLRSRADVVCMEGFNARFLCEADLGEKVDLAVMDVSFISQTLLYEAVSSVLKEGGVFISLIKPQFEAGKSGIGKNGIVKDEKVRLSVCEKIKDCSKIYGLEVVKIIESPILGGDGNKEYLAHFVLTNNYNGEK